jgi:hypothetical protein
VTIASRKPEAGVEKRLSPDPRLVYVLPDVSVFYGVGGGEKNMTTEGSMRLQSFDLRLFDIADTDLEKLHALSLMVGWPHRLKDWEMLRESGYGIVAQDEIGRVFGSAMWFPFADDFTTVGMADGACPETDGIAPVAIEFDPGRLQALSFHGFHGGKDRLSASGNRRSIGGA